MKRIVIDLTLHVPHYDQAQWQPVLTEEGRTLANEKLAEGEHEVKTYAFYNADGTVCLTVRDLTNP